MPRRPKEHKNFIRERIADAVDISKDILLDTSLMRVTGCRELIIENYKGILEYTDVCILIKANPNAIKISGTELEIKTITDEMLFISGSIAGINFVSI